MPSIRHDDVMLRIIKDLADVRSALRRVVATLPLYDIDNENTPAILTESQNNYVPGNYDTLRLSSNKIVSITGIRNGVRGRKLRIFNVGNYPILIPNLSTASLSHNRFQLQSGSEAVDLVGIEPNTNIEFYYDNTLQKWMTTNISTPYKIETSFTAQSAPHLTKAVCYSPELGLLVAVGTSVCMTSSDGVTWNSQSITARTWQDVAWSPALSLFVAVASDTSGIDVISTSPDGSVWTPRTAPSKLGWTRVVWSPELSIFISTAQASDGTHSVMSSANGTVWNLQTSPIQCHGCCWSPELSLFVAVTPNGTSNQVMTSANGTLWTQGINGTMPNASWSSVAWSAELSLFVAVSPTVFAISGDGFVWSSITPGVLGIVNVTWCVDVNMFIAVGRNCVAFSFDGITWNVSNNYAEIIDASMGFVYDDGSKIIEGLDSTLKLEVGMRIIASTAGYNNRIASIVSSANVSTTESFSIPTSDYIGIVFKKDTEIAGYFTGAVYVPTLSKVVIVALGGDNEVITMP